MFLIKQGIQSRSSSVQSTPEKYGYLGYTLRGSEIPQKFPKSSPKRELLKTCFDKENKIKHPLKSRMVEQQLKACNKNLKNAENRKGSSSNSGPRKQTRKGENPFRFTPSMEKSDFESSISWICKNSACRAVLSLDDAFCRRCSCCICHKFDDNKDPSLWLVCESEGSPGDSCGLSCHIECALEQEKLGVVKLGQYMQLDGSYCCASCGKVSGILGLLDNTSRFKELHEIVTEAKTKLEAEVGPMNGESVKMARGIVSRLAIAGDVQKLCSNAIDKAEEWLAKVPNSIADCTVVSLPAACRFLFEEIASSSLAIVLIDIPMQLTDSIKGYKLWYCKTREETFPKEPAAIFPRDKKRISVKDLQPCTEYTFRIMSYTEDGDLGHSEAKCFTKSVEIFNKNASPSGCKKENPAAIGNPAPDIAGPSSEFRVRDLGKLLHLAWAQEQGHSEGIFSADIEQSCGVAKSESPKAHLSPPPPISRDLDLNVASVPDLNEDLTPPLESSRDEDIGPFDDAASDGIDKNGLARSNGSGPSDDLQAWAPTQNRDVPAVDSLLEAQRKRAATAMEEAHDCDSALVNGSPYRLLGGAGSLDGSFEYCVKTIRGLECEGHIKQEFRLKFLTWYSLVSSEQGRRVVNTFIQTLGDDPKSLAGQLVDSFSDIISRKRPRNGCTSKLP
ncbi:hypothetical protein KSS87_005252, partial [Heliosperma pusillum]